MWGGLRRDSEEKQQCKRGGSLLNSRPMQEAVSTGVTEKERSKTPLSLKALAARIRAESPTRAEWLGALTTSVLLILSFPDFSLAFLAWFALVPLLITIV